MLPQKVESQSSVVQRTTQLSILQECAHRPSTPSCFEHVQACQCMLFRAVPGLVSYRLVFFIPSLANISRQCDKGCGITAFCQNGASEGLIARDAPAVNEAAGIDCKECGAEYEQCRKVRAVSGLRTTLTRLQKCKWWMPQCHQLCVCEGAKYKTVSD